MAARKTIIPVLAIIAIMTCGTLCAISDDSSAADKDLFVGVVEKINGAGVGGIAVIDVDRADMTKNNAIVPEKVLDALRDHAGTTLTANVISSNGNGSYSVSLCTNDIPRAKSSSAVSIYADFGFGKTVLNGVEYNNKRIINVVSGMNGPLEFNTTYKLDLNSVGADVTSQIGTPYSLASNGKSPTTSNIDSTYCISFTTDNGGTYKLVDNSLVVDSLNRVTVDTTIVLVIAILGAIVAGTIIFRK